MNDADIIVIGAGITGLTVARQLARSGRKVLVLEGRGRVGGRIHTIRDGEISIETGAEFIHGELEATQLMLSEYDINYRPIGGAYVRIKDARVQEADDCEEHRSLLLHKLGQLSHDMTVTAFLDQHFPEAVYNDFKNSMRSFVEGYDSADADLASAFAFRDELSEPEDDQYRVNGTYSALIDAIVKELSIRHCDVLLSSVVKHVHWTEDKVIVTTAESKQYQASQIVITIPLGVLTADENAEAAIMFHPKLDAKVDAARSMGFGHVIKTVFEMSPEFWQNAMIRKQLNNGLDQLGFIFSDASMPTWWTHHPDDSRLLTGWLGGLPAEKLKHTDDMTLLHLAHSSLAYITGLSHAEIESSIVKQHVFNWPADPFTLGAYAYKTIHTVGALKVLNTPVSNTIFFAGEALYEGVEMGTVEAAIRNAQAVAAKMV